VVSPPRVLRPDSTMLPLAWPGAAVGAMTTLLACCSMPTRMWLGIEARPTVAPP
jgi:hypothetical protein